MEEIKEVEKSIEKRAELLPARVRYQQAEEPRLEQYI